MPKLTVSIPEPLPHRTREAVDIPGPCRVLVLPDVHLPHHDKAALTLAIQAGRRERCNVVLVNGDLVNFDPVSRWNNEPQTMPIVGEVEQGRQFLRYIRQQFPRARIVFREGNHDERLAQYIWQNAPKIYGVFDLTLRKALDCDDAGIEYVGDKRVVRLGKLATLHGHEHRFAISNPVNPARGLFLRAKAPALCSHFHQVSEHTEKTIEGKLITTWSTGCLCNLSPDYMPYNSHAHGFAIVETDQRGAYNVRNCRIYRGEIWGL